MTDSTQSWELCSCALASSLQLLYLPSSAQTTSETPLPSSATDHPVGDTGQVQQLLMRQSTQNLVTPHLRVQKKIHTWCRETPGNPSSATATAGGRHEEGSCTPSPRVLQCQHHTQLPGKPHSHQNPTDLVLPISLLAMAHPHTTDRVRQRGCSDRAEPGETGFRL